MTFAKRFILDVCQDTDKLLQLLLQSALDAYQLEGWFTKFI